MATKTKQSARAKDTVQDQDPLMLIRLLSRAATRLQDHEAFKSGKIGLAEWTFLQTLASDPTLRGITIARKLGFTRQRATQIMRSLSKAGLITATPNQEDTRKKDLAITIDGQSRLEQVDAQMTAMFNQVLEKRPKAFAQIRNAMMTLSKAIPTAKMAKAASPTK